MADDNNSTANESQNTNANAGGQTAGDSQTGADTQTAQTSTSTEGNQQQQAQQQTAQTTADNSSVDKKFTQADLDKHIKERLGRKLRAELIRRGIDPDAKDGESTTKPTVDSLSKERDDAVTRLRVLEARDQLEAFVADKRNNLTVSNVRGLFKFVKDDLEFDDDGKVTNFKDVLATAKAEAGEFFRAQSHSIDAGAGSRSTNGVDMNSIIRAAAGR